MPALHLDANLASLTICKAVSLSLVYGNCDASCYAYVMLARIGGPLFDDYKTGFRFGHLGHALVERRGLRRFEARTCGSFAVFVVRWMKHVRACNELLQSAFETALHIGDLTYAAYTRNHLNANLLFAGEHLLEVQKEAERGLAFVNKTHFSIITTIITTQLALVRTLRGLTLRLGCFDDRQFNELRIEHHLSSNSVFGLAACWYWIRKLQARYIAGDFETAVDAASKAQRLLWTSSMFAEEAEYHFYGALARAVYSELVPSGERQQQLDAVAAHHKQLRVWAENCPENFENRAALVGAEIARLEGRELDAERLYEHAIRSARDNGFVNNEAIAYERASDFYRARRFDQIADLYLRNARYAYTRWGADGKVRQLEEMYPHLRTQEPVPSPTSTIAASVERLDLTTVIKMLEAVAGEMVLEKLLDTLMRTAITQAGAERGLLILLHAAEPRIAAEATTGKDTVLVELRDTPLTASVVPETVLHYVLHSQESVVLNDAVTESSFATDPYIRQRQARSILCLPLINRAKLIGVLYVENNLTPRAFAPARIAVLKILASQAAISLENSSLYRDLQQREAKIRRLVDANIIGIFFWDFEGRILEANDAFLRMVAHDREDLVAGRLRWTDLTPPKWLERDVQHLVPEQKLTGRLEPFEKEYLRKDGSRVPVLAGTATFEEGGNEGVAFVLDLSERKRAEAEASESERRYREVQTELAHANRLATMGQFTASIAHEINQPIAAARNNAASAMNFLSRNPPDLAEVREALECVVNDTDRAGDIIGGIRKLVKKTPRQRDDRVDINEAIREVIVLTRGEAVKNGVSVHMQAAERLPLIPGDRVQLQQVALNLISNAIEAMTLVDHGARELLISTERRGADEILVAVHDSGPGIAREHLGRVFDPLYTTKASGMGLGLSICRSIVELHGGHLWAEVNEPKGAVFQFTLAAVNE